MSGNWNSWFLIRSCPWHPESFRKNPGSWAPDPHTLGPLTLAAAVLPVEPPLYPFTSSMFQPNWAEPWPCSCFPSVGTTLWTLCVCVAPGPGRVLLSIHAALLACPEGSSLSWTPWLTACYLSRAVRRACLVLRLLCPHIRSSHGGAAWPLPHTVGSSRLCPLPGPQAASLEPSVAGPLSAAAILPSHDGPAGWGYASPSWWAQRWQWQ